ncbi:hypothetical protein GPX89_02245 [Nocardia sp. ET3-3]|uniref:DUF6299 domain-containing protein n=1 Tax=Nocardia terrae TaxID=2675851 RepID=A0A7K1UNZ2_9NOCA|nr:DUF6299 family protein [Nocardia terrae]MVU76062.1 hypothetical protein [Nocardia terrae]
MVEYLWTSERRMTICETRILKLAVATAVGFVSASMLAAPATADPSPSLTVDGIQYFNADGSVHITGTYTCTGDQIKSLRNSQLRQGDAKSATTTRSGLLTCDGTAQDYTIDIPASGSVPFQPGPAEFSSTWQFYNDAGSHSEAQLTNIPVTLSDADRTARSR